LLAFARRQPLEPVVIKLDTLLQDMEELLRRVLGETVELVTHISPALWNTFADPGQVENVILNLAINARDAMSGNGRLTIEAVNACLHEDEAGLDQVAGAGEYVMLTVSDTGIGMASEVREQAFEPFFTTKPEGQGTGLGLSMVYGFVKQSGGQIALSSESGQGTEIRIYLPRALEAEAAESQRLSGPVEGGNETILVVEDDPDVRCTTIDMLTGLGYRVLEASDASSALALVQEGHAVDLLFTDVIMPGSLDSTDLARRAKLILPDLIVLFTSGYTDDALVRGGRLDQGVSLLSKPFHHDDLARKIRHLFRNRQQAAMIRGAAQAAEPAPPKPAAAPRLRILIVEDEEFIREALQELLADTGHEIAVAGTAEEAQEMLAQRRFDILFTDVSLPGKSGIELATAAVGQLPDLKVIIASGYGKELPTPIGEALADSIFLPKPYDIGEIEQAIAQIACPDHMTVQ
jgi:signal transduction histidine kinase